uniref:Uncharacterized protein n=1 Tax=Poecilia reticulata TaxID=8081 RepID=A0A3P9N317_POERE
MAAFHFLESIEPCWKVQIYRNENPLLASIKDRNIERLGRNGRVLAKKPLLTKKATKSRLTFGQETSMIPKLWTDETRMDLYGMSLSHCN